MEKSIKHLSPLLRFFPSSRMGFGVATHFYVTRLAIIIIIDHHRHRKCRSMPPQCRSFFPRIIILIIWYMKHHLPASSTTLFFRSFFSALFFSMGEGYLLALGTSCLMLRTQNEAENLFLSTLWRHQLAFEWSEEMVKFDGAFHCWLVFFFLRRSHSGGWNNGISKTYGFRD